MSRKSDPSLRLRILKEAEHLLHLRGYHCTSLDDIASCCKMTKANLFYHFRSKEDLGLCVMDYKIAAYRCQCLDPWESHPDPVRAIAELFSSSARFFKNNGCKAGCFIGNIALEMSDINDQFRNRAGSFFEEWVSRLEKLLKRHRDSGRFSKSLRPRAAAEAILALYEGAIMIARTRRDPAVFERVGRQACQILDIHRQDGKRDTATKAAMP